MMILALEFLIYFLRVKLIAQNHGQGSVWPFGFESSSPGSLRLTRIGLGLDRTQRLF